MKSVCIALTLRKSLVICNILLTCCALTSSRADAADWWNCPGPWRLRARFSDFREPPVLYVDWSPDGSRIAGGLGDEWVGAIKIWDALSGAVVRSWRGHPYAVRSVKWSPDGARIASIGITGYLVLSEEQYLTFPDTTPRIWAADTGELLQTLTGSSRDIQSLAWSPDGTRIAGGSSDGTIRIWQVDTGDLLQTLSAHVGGVPALAWSPAFITGGRWIASGGGLADNTIKIWDADSGNLIRVATQIGVTSLQWSANGYFLATGSVDRTVRVWRSDFSSTSTIASHGYEVTSVDWSPSFDEVASGANDSAVRLSNPFYLDTWSAFPAAGPVSSVAFSPDGSWLASAGDGQVVRVWNSNTGKLAREWIGHASAVLCLAFSSDGLLASAGADGAVRLWDPATGTPRTRTRGAWWRPGESTRRAHG